MGGCSPLTLSVSHTLFWNTDWKKHPSSALGFIIGSSDLLKSKTEGDGRSLPPSWYAGEFKWSENNMSKKKRWCLYSLKPATTCRISHQTTNTNNKHRTTWKRDYLLKKVFNSTFALTKLHIINGTTLFKRSCTLQCTCTHKETHRHTQASLCKTWGTEGEYQHPHICALHSTCVVWQVHWQMGTSQNRKCWKILKWGGDAVCLLTQSRGPSRGLLGGGHRGYWVVTLISYHVITDRIRHVYVHEHSF